MLNKNIRQGILKVDSGIDGWVPTVGCRRLGCGQGYIAVDGTSLTVVEVLDQVSFAYCHKCEQQ